MTRPVLRLLADDLTGALDTAAEFSVRCGPVPVRWDAARVAGSTAFSTATREAAPEDARAAMRAFAPLLADADIAYRKLDSLLRGPVAAELAACWATGAWRHGVLAPAFPAQGRIGRDGRAYTRATEGTPAPIPLPDWAAEGLTIHRGRLDAPLPEGLAWFDAETDEDLARIAALGRTARGPVLWAGSGGLARALAGSARVVPDMTLATPVLGLFGSDQAVTARQLAACGDAWLRVADAADTPRVRRQMERGAALLSVALPAETPRTEAARRIAATFAALLPSPAGGGRLDGGIPRPGTLIVAGGETLRTVCDALGATGLLATGLVMPGVPRSVLQGGTWDGLPVISKSGAFGGDALWRELLAAHHLPRGTHDA